ncbi:30S ribosomal protein S8 [bacterium]|nr:30S ribosomal protein S8 [bacterium]
MSMTDPIADFLTRIRNAQAAGHFKVDIPASNMKRSITKILKKQGFIKSYINIDDGLQGILRLALKYSEGKKPVIQGLVRISKPGLRQYTSVENLPRVKNNYGIAILSTPKGVLTNKDCKRQNVGGEVLCYVW